MPPVDLISAASVRVKSALLATSATRYPCANRRARAAPSPAPTPTTTATGALSDTFIAADPTRVRTFTLRGCPAVARRPSAVQCPGHGRRRRLGDHRPALLRPLRLP